MESLSRAESLTLAVHVATTDSVAVQQLAALAACTFPLACPPSMAPDNIASFINTNLSPARFAEYLADPQRAILTAQHDGRIVGYAMLIRGVVDNTAELSKMYVLPEYHGAEVGSALMERALSAAEEWGVRCVWLGVNQANQRAQRFYIKSDFTISGTRTFQVGTRLENDFVMVRELR